MRKNHSLFTKTLSVVLTALLLIGSILLVGGIGVSMIFAKRPQDSEQPHHEVIEETKEDTK